MRLFLALLIAPLLEVAVFIAVGREIGILPTIALTVLTALIGSYLLRHQGLKALRDIQADMARDQVPARPLVDGAMISAAGLLLLTPGFVSDAIGFCLFIPPVREFFWKKIVGRLNVSIHTSGGSFRTADDVVDLDETDYSDVPDKKPEALTNRADSPWRESKEP